MPTSPEPTSKPAPMWAVFLVLVLLLAAMVLAVYAMAVGAAGTLAANEPGKLGSSTWEGGR